MSAHARHIEYTKKIVDWQALVKDDLREVEIFLADAISSDVPNIRDVSNHLLSAGGKRLRPALVILASRASGSLLTPRTKAIAAAVEIIHMASLMHDDVIDHSDYRRGKVTANACWGNRFSILTGDYMLSKAFQLLARDGNQRVLESIAETSVKMSESEALQSLCERNIEGWRENYWQIIRNKTARFLSVCCRYGAILAGADSSTEEALAQYGMEMGVAFQLTDDILDIAGEPEVTGKSIGSDLREGKVTLPALLAIDSMPDEERKLACGLIENNESSDEDVMALCETIRSMDAIESARDHARAFAEKANECLANLPPSDAKDALIALSMNIIYRAS